MSPPICYLCGLPIVEDRGDDHIPPRQFFAPVLRKAVNTSKLVTLPSHQKCNVSYSLDEEYFTATLAPIAFGTAAANAVVAHHAQKFRAGKSAALLAKVLKQFADRPSGLHLPRDLVVMKVEGVRIKRVAWKIVRGLYYLETNTVLPEATPFMIELIEPENKDPSEHAGLWDAVKAQQSRGVYAGVFDYKYLQLKAGDELMHAWGMLLWDRIMLFIAHVHPAGSAAP